MNRSIPKYLRQYTLIKDKQYEFIREKIRCKPVLWCYSCMALTVSVFKLHQESQELALVSSKAFNKLWQAALLNKLPSYGLPHQFSLGSGVFYLRRLLLSLWMTKIPLPFCQIWSSFNLRTSLNFFPPQYSYFFHFRPHFQYPDDCTLHPSIQYTRRPK